MKRLIIFAAVTFSVSTVRAQSPVDEGKQKLESSLEDLSALREEIAEEKEPLASRLLEIESEVVELRRKADRMSSLVDNQSLNLAEMENRTEAFRDEASYVVNLLNDYFNRVNASLAVSEVPRYEPALLDLIQAADREDLDYAAKLAVQIPGLETPIERLRALIGGVRFDGSAVLPDGQLSEGSFAMFGPVTYFADGSHAGLVQSGSSGQPALVELDAKAFPQIQSFVETGEGPLPLDSTLGRALAIKTAEESLPEHFMKGGIWMWPIAFFGLFAFLIGVIKFAQIMSFKGVSEEEIEEVCSLLKNDQEEEAIARTKSLPSLSADVISTGLKYRFLPKHLLEEFLFEKLLTIKPKLEKGVAFIALSASVAPLLGLLGTVTGMIETFKLLTLFGTGDAKSLSSGISKALITTEFGLVSAIPALVLSAVIGRMVAGKLSNLERASLNLANTLAALNYAREEEKEPMPLESA